VLKTDGRDLRLFHPETKLVVYLTSLMRRNEIASPEKTAFKKNCENRNSHI